jgi:hypothetical protein
MKKVVVESLYEYRQFSSLHDELNEEELNELNLKNLAQSVKGAVTGQSQKAALINFFKGTEGKDDVPDESVTKAFDAVYSYSYGKYPKLKEASAKWTPAQKYTLMKKSKDAMDKNPKFDTPIMIIKNGKVLSGAITRVNAPQPGMKANQ